MALEIDFGGGAQVCAHDLPAAVFCVDCEAVDLYLADDPEHPGRDRDDLAPDLGLIDWATFWARERTDVDYVIPGLLPEGSAGSIYSAAGGGKSLLALEWAVCKALGRRILSEPVAPGHVLYVDHEMDRDLLEERLTALGVDERTDLSRLHYSLLGDWPPLDTPEGGSALLAAAEDVGAVLVIVDTISRAIEGEENPADTWLRLYRHTVRRLKVARIAFLRLDHSGKDTTKGERGSSAKRSDVDTVYKVEPVGPDRINLVRQKNRLHLPGPDVVALKRTTDPLRHVAVAIDLQREHKLSELVAAIDRLDLPDSAGRTVIGRALKDAGIRARNADLALAVARRKAGPPPVPTLRVGASGDRSAATLGDSRGQVGDSPGTGFGETRGQPRRAPVPAESGTGFRPPTTDVQQPSLTEALAPCESCGLPAMTSPCTACRRLIDPPTHDQNGATA
jgi:hypothetical protein